MVDNNVHAATPCCQQASNLLPAIFVEVFTVTFLAEWGDRSQIVTIGA